MTDLPPPTLAPPQYADPRSARAAAKGEKAHRKAMRPFYKKKRYWILAIGAVLIVLIIVNAGNSSTTDKNGVSTGLGTKNAAADVSPLAWGAKDAIGERRVELTVTNHSSKRSDYIIEISGESPDGKVQYGTAVAIVDNLEPGQSSPQTAGFLEKVPDDAKLVLKSVSRHASI